MEEKKTKTVTVGIFSQGQEKECLKSLEELERLTETAGGYVFAVVTQLKDPPDSATCIGKGKLKELAELCQNNDVEKLFLIASCLPHK